MRGAGYYRDAAVRTDEEERFFFQAEDGIRDVAVTGVQTCALPISDPARGADGRHRGGPQGSRRRRPRPPADRGGAGRGGDGRENPRRRQTQAAVIDRGRPRAAKAWRRSEEHTSELQSRLHLVCRLLLEKKKKSYTSD